MEAMLTQLAWTADRGLRGAFLPGMLPRTDIPPLHDEYFDPFWAMLEDRGMWAVCHAGFGDNAFADKMHEATSNPANTSSVEILDQMNNKSEDFFHRAYEPLQALWQMMLGGVFDRFPDLRFVLTEVRADWMPGLLAHLDAAFERGRDDLPATRRPSEYWHSNCLQSVSFMHKCEVGLRHDVGVGNIIFGRDYPHPEGTWPNTREWLRDALVGVPEHEMRMLLGENAIRMLDLDRASLEHTATRIGFSVDDLLGPGAEIDPRKVESWDLRSGYLKPPEHVDPASVDAFFLRDPRLAVVVS
jgi:predicted TIM-barrel fold metal-dependent hydrolase